MKTLREGGIPEVLSLRNRVGRALGKQEIPKVSHDILWDLLNRLEEEIKVPTQEEAPCQLQGSNQSPGSVSEPD
jgi:hypothetical protein